MKLARITEASELFHGGKVHARLVLDLELETKADGTLETLDEVVAQISGTPATAPPPDEIERFELGDDDKLRAKPREPEVDLDASFIAEAAEGEASDAATADASHRKRKH
jgi:hypothetical protein